MVKVKQRAATATMATVVEKFIHELSGIYDAEHCFLEAQQAMVQQARNNQLKSMLQAYKGETEQQIKNLEQAFGLMGTEPQRVTCSAAAGLVRDSKKLIHKLAANPGIRDVAIAEAQSKVEHFEIGCYRDLVMGAEQIGENELANLLGQNLQQQEQRVENIKHSIPQLLQQAMTAGSGGR